MSGACRYRSLPIGFSEGLSSDAIALYTSVYTSSEMQLCGIAYTSQLSLIKKAGIGGAFNFVKAAKLRRTISELGDKVVWWEEYNILFIHGFSKMQAANPNIWIGAIKNAENLPKAVKVVVMQSILNDFVSSISEDKGFYAKTLEKLMKISCLKPLPKPLREQLREQFGTVTESVTETHGRVTGAPIPEVTEVTEVTEAGNQLSDGKNKNSKKEVSKSKQLVADYLHYCPSGKIISFQFAEGNSKLKDKISYVVKKFSRDEWVRVFRLAEESDWLTGKIPSANDSQYFRGMSLGWIITPKIMEAILSGRYQNRNNGSGNPAKDNFDTWLAQQESIPGEVIHD